ncbi:MAG: peptide chain release factor N(5)-glutamine methyltransferase [Cyanobacteria bacterium P01_A01_bin.135]
MYKAAGSSVWQWRQQARQQAIARQIDPAEVDWVLLAVSDLDRLALKLGTVPQRPSITLTLPLRELTQRWQRRVTERSPLQYVTGTAPWRNFDLAVSPAVLIPRPETEQLIDIVDQTTQTQPALRQGTWADLGTGSGAIALGLAELMPSAEILAVDCSPDALTVAQQNAQRYSLGDRIQFLEGSWFESLSLWRGQLSGMVSNPPYIPTAMLAGLDPEVQHDPQMALDGGEDGLAAIRQLIAIAPDYLPPGGVWLAETMQGQPEAVVRLLGQGPYGDVQVFSDLAGIERFVLARRS